MWYVAGTEAGSLTLTLEHECEVSKRCEARIRIRKWD